MDVGRECQPSGDTALGIMVASEQHNRNTRSLKLPDAVHKKQAGVVIRPIAVIEVAGEDDEIDSLGQRELDQAGERLARGPAQRLRWRALVIFQSAKRAVQMDVGGVQESKHNRSLTFEGFGDRLVDPSRTPGGIVFMLS
jgi:hypothetical protein